MGDYYIHSSAEVSERAKIGVKTRIWHFAHIREDASIGKNCSISKDVYVDVGVSIGNNVKIQNGVSVYKGVTVEDEVFLGPNATFSNDLYPRVLPADWKILPTLIKKGASVGANATIVCGVTLGEYSMVGAGSVVTKDVPAYGLVVGNPARLKGFVCKCGHKAYPKEKQINSVLLECESCKESVSIPIAIYNLLEVKNGAR
ncbi:acyltransferase [Candidatus Omnitrophota bacterium]